MRWDESLSLGGDGRKHALLIKADTVAATSILGALKTRASNLQLHTRSVPIILNCNMAPNFPERHDIGGQSNLPSPTVPTCDCRALSRGSSLIHHLRRRRRRRRLRIHLRGPLIGTWGRWQAVGVLRTLHLRMDGGHIRRRWGVIGRRRVLVCRSPRAILLRG